jgi:hypothetical protein
MAVLMQAAAAVVVVLAMATMSIMTSAIAASVK